MEAARPVRGAGRGNGPAEKPAPRPGPTPPRVRRGRPGQETLGQRGRAGDPLYGIRRVLRRGHDHHADLSWTRLLPGLDLGDPNGEVAAAWIAAQDRWEWWSWARRSSRRMP